MPLVTIVIALFFSFLLNLGGGQKGGQMTGVWGSKVYRVIFFLPQVLAVAIVGVLFQSIYRPDETGVINGLLGKIGVDPVGWLIDPDIALLVDHRRDGLAGRRLLRGPVLGRHVRPFPRTCSRPPRWTARAGSPCSSGSRSRCCGTPCRSAWVYLGIAAFDAFALVQVLSVDRGGPDNSTTVLPLEIWRTAFSFSKFGYASAMGVALFFMTITFAAITLRVTRRERIEF